MNRGWVPPQKIVPSTRKEGQVEGEVTFDAVVRHTEKVLINVSVVLCKTIEAILKTSFLRL